MGIRACKTLRVRRGNWSVGGVMTPPYGVRGIIGSAEVEAGGGRSVIAPTGGGGGRADAQWASLRGAGDR